MRSDIAELRLGHRAALSLLQGMSLSALLLAGHELRVRDVALGNAFDVILNVRAFRPYEAPPRLSGLVLGKIVQVPEGIDQTLVLEALISDALKPIDSSAALARSSAGAWG